MRRKHNSLIEPQGAETNGEDEDKVFVLNESWESVKVEVPDDEDD